jgi:hypothetical protein
MQWYQDGQETICKQFPVGMKRSGITPNRKLFATLSYRYETQRCHVE